MYPIIRVEGLKIEGLDGVSDNSFDEGEQSGVWNNREGVLEIFRSEESRACDRDRFEAKFGFEILVGLYDGDGLGGWVSSKDDGGGGGNTSGILECSASVSSAVHVLMLMVGCGDWSDVYPYDHNGVVSLHTQESL